jgi:hypothetical protein
MPRAAPRSTGAASRTGTGGPIIYRYGNHYSGAPRLRDHPLLNMSKPMLSLAHPIRGGRSIGFSCSSMPAHAPAGRASRPGCALPAQRSHPGEAVFHFLLRLVLVHGH